MAQTYINGLNILETNKIDYVCLKIFTEATYMIFPISYVFNIR